jgi:hypothetical protein
VFRVPLPGAYELTDDEKQEVLNAALAEVDRRRTLVEQHHDQWHGPLQEAFPLREFLKRYADEQ